ncbi:MAG: DUF1501 domain-containing protein [Pseudotabrizicola sp.]|uniref:DUF1501 domain-containing protein n=1 Tax=Pseudotabrizicola sp. TaxID=2939647 RepID=UPI00272FC81B|nr:DUF1501 domain-containing protein [Pseudotabrizicola sp.]MDP2080750.1 DUF1501 domain-containing protein [Pseudotabrizicola sp.]MDZ7574664.1 DUF1501 domain-containing protein [Pseudotabrizicola sp.]
MDRRLFLKGLTGTACSLAAHPMMTTVTLAASDGSAPLGDHRLIVVILRGAMDGLDLVRPSGDPLFAGYRPTLSANQGPDLTGYFSLNPTLTGLMPLWQAGHLGFVQATSTPYRDQRSHFDGQDILEAGTGLDVPNAAVRDGWLNRMLQSVPGLRAQTAFAIGTDSAPLLQGPAPVSNWQPDLRLDLSAQSRLLLDHIYHDDALFRDAATEAVSLTESIDLSRMDGMASPGAGGRLADIERLTDFAADRLREDTRVAAFSLNGWDTHRNQSGGITLPLRRLERVVLRMSEQLGPDIWGKTLLLAMTEFGRTVAENGTKGTDHGTGGAMLMAGGALKGGRVMGKWPGLDESALYQRRDLMPTSDVRAWAAWAMRGMYGFDRTLLETNVFPGLSMGDNPGLLA